LVLEEEEEEVEEEDGYVLCCWYMLSGWSAVEKAYVVELR
jgi:hypothetical protein